MQKYKKEMNVATLLAVWSDGHCIITVDTLRAFNQNMECLEACMEC
jgi:hypothetical protein